MSRDLQNICSRTKKKTRVEILKFESKKMGVELKKKYSSRERENADQLCCLSMSSLHRYELSLRKHPFLLALRRWGRFARNSGSCNFTRMSFH